MIAKNHQSQVDLLIFDQNFYKKSLLMLMLAF